MTTLKKRRVRQRYWWRYCLYDEHGTLYFSTNRLDVALTEGKSQNLEVRQRLASIRIGKNKIENRYKVIRKITSQLELLN